MWRGHIILFLFVWGHTGKMKGRIFTYGSSFSSLSYSGRSLWLVGVLIFSLAWCLFSETNQLYAASKKVTYSLQAMALAPNAGGQMAYALRRGTNEREMSVFANTYLYAGDYPLVGAIYSWRFPIVNDDWFWQAFVELGAGITTAGPVAEILWGTIMLWTVRVDIATHLMFVPSNSDRSGRPANMILWSYPIWVGLAVPL